MHNTPAEQRAGVTGSLSCAWQDSATPIPARCELEEPASQCVCLCLCVTVATYREVFKPYAHLENVWQRLTSQTSILSNLLKRGQWREQGVKTGINATQWASDVQPNTAGIIKSH